MIARVIWISACDGVGSPEGGYASVHARQDFSWSAATYAICDICWDRGVEVLPVLIRNALLEGLDDLLWARAGGEISLGRDDETISSWAPDAA
jgi:hypothetical protein